MSHANISIFVPHIGCPHQCSFCNQKSISGKGKAPTPEDVKQVCEQNLILRKGHKKETQLAFFGGSFTAIERGYMCSLLEAAQEYLGEDGFSGIRISTRPDAIDDEILDLLVKYHVNAIELGVQSMDEGVLAANERGHSAQDVLIACQKIKEHGIELGLQMMTGLYQSTPELDTFTAQEIAKQKPRTVRIYPTVVIKGTRLASLYEQGLYVPPALEESVELCSKLLEFFTEQNITVIRLGLHAEQSLEEDYVAGPYHPAFKELCEGKIYLKKAMKQIKNFAPNTPLNIFVNDRALSKMAGQKRCNLKKIQERNPVKIKPNSTLADFCVAVEEQTLK